MLVFLQISMLFLIEPLVLKSGTTLECESITKRGEWVVVVLSKTDKRYESSGNRNKFKIKTEKVDWNKTAREMSLRQNQKSPKNSSSHPEEKKSQRGLAVDQIDVQKNENVLPKKQSRKAGTNSKMAESPKSSQRNAEPQAEKLGSHEDRYEAIRSKIKALDLEIIDLERSIVWPDSENVKDSGSNTKKNLEIEAEINRKMRQIEKLKQEAEDIGKPSKTGW